MISTIKDIRNFLDKSDKELADELGIRDLYDQMMDPDQYDEVKELKENFHKRAGII